MPSAHDRINFGPPRAEGSVRAFALALFVHALLIAALTWGINWQRTDQSIGYEAEIWSAVPQMVAPRLVEAAPAPTAPAPPPPPPPPQPEVKAPPVKVTPPAPDVDIALEQEKKRRQLVEQKEAEAKVLAERQRALEVAKKAREKDLKAREDQAKRLAAEEAKKAQAQLDTQNAQNAQKARELAKAQDTEKQAQAALQKQREDNINRIKGLAGASGGANDTGAALRATGPSASYAGKLNAAIRPNVVFSGEISGNPVTTVEVRVMSDGTVISQRVIKSSGDKNWDDAAINAVIRTRVLPRDENGRMPDTIMHVEMRPRG